MRPKDWPGLGMTDFLKGPADSLAQRSTMGEPESKPHGFRRWQPFPASANLAIFLRFKGLVYFVSILTRAFEGKALFFFSCIAEAFRNVTTPRAPAPPRSKSPASYTQMPWAVVWTGRSGNGA